MDLTASSTYGDACCSLNHSTHHCKTNSKEDAAPVAAFDLLMICFTIHNKLQSQSSADQMQPLAQHLPSNLSCNDALIVLQ